MQRGPLILCSGPSGVGKSTVIARLLASHARSLRLAVSATTRPPRVGELDGVHYYFWDRPRFELAIQAGELLECAEVHGNWYGTPTAEVERYLAQGIGVILDIDVQGFDQVRQKGMPILSIFLESRNYEQRLRDRGTEDEAAIQRRLRNAERELSRAAEYLHRILNDDLDETVRRIAELIDMHLSPR